MNARSGNPSSLPIRSRASPQIGRWRPRHHTSRGRVAAESRSPTRNGASSSALGRAPRRALANRRGSVSPSNRGSDQCRSGLRGRGNGNWKNASGDPRSGAPVGRPLRVISSCRESIFRLTLGSIGRSSMPGNDGPESALAGWGGWTRTGESVGIKIRAYCRRIPADLAETAQQRQFASELRRCQCAAAATISRVALWWRKGEKYGGGADQYAWLVGPERKQSLAGRHFALDLSLERSMHGGPSLTGSLLSPASALRPPRGFGWWQRAVAPPRWRGVSACPRSSKGERRRLGLPQRSVRKRPPA
jgi:hypothetical protein